MGSYVNKKLVRLESIENCSNRMENDISKIHSDMDGVSSRITGVKNETVALNHSWKAFQNSMNKNFVDIRSQMGEVSVRVTKNAEDIKIQNDNMLSLRQELLETTDDKLQEKLNAWSTDMRKDIKADVIQSIEEDRESEKKEFQLDVLKDQAHKKKLNLLLFGLEEQGSAAEDLCLASKLFKEKLALDNLNLHVAYRIGKQERTSGSSRPLVVRFSNMADRWAVWNKKGTLKNIKDNSFWIQEDLPLQLREELRVLLRIAKVAKSKPEVYKGVKVKDYKLHLNGKKYRRDDASLLPKELRPEQVYSPSNESTMIFFTKNSPLSNHHPSMFSIDGQNFSSVEQYLAFNRAELSQRKDLLPQIMDTTDPKQHKQILNLRKEDRTEEWKMKARTIIVHAIREKFNQNVHLADFLLDTYPKVLGEASKDSF